MSTITSILSALFSTLISSAPINSIEIYIEKNFYHMYRFKFGDSSCNKLDLLRVYQNKIFKMTALNTHFGFKRDNYAKAVIFNSRPVLIADENTQDIPYQYAQKMAQNRTSTPNVKAINTVNKIRYSWSISSIKMSSSEMIEIPNEMKGCYLHTRTDDIIEILSELDNTDITIASYKECSSITIEKESPTVVSKSFACKGPGPNEGESMAITFESHIKMLDARNFIYWYNAGVPRYFIFVSYTRCN